MSMGHASKLSINGVSYAFLSAGFGGTDTFEDDVGNYGSRDRIGDRVVKVKQDVRGTARLRPTPTELDKLLQLLTGDTKGVDNLIEFQAAGPTEHTVICDNAREVFTDSLCKLNALTLEAASGGVLFVSGDWLCKTEAVAGSTPGAPTHGAPFVLSESVFTHGSIHPIRNMTLTLSNNCPEDDFENSLTRSNIPPGAITATLKVAIPYDDAAASTLRTSGIAGAAATLIFTKGTNVLTITIANLKFPQQMPAIGNRNDETIMDITGTCYATAAAAGVVFTSVLAA